MADEKHILKPINSVAVMKHIHGPSLRRCLSDITFSRANQQVRVCKSLRGEGKENIYKRIIAKMPSGDLKLKVANQSVKTGSTVGNESDAESLTDEELPFDKNNNEGPYDSSKSQLPAHNTPPPSPTWNLTVLCNAASPEIRRMQQERDNLTNEGRSSTSSLPSTMLTSPSEDNCHDCLDLMSSQESAMELEVFTSRKDKSLGRLCDKFLARYSDDPGITKIEICLDEVAKELAVERRRIYDIVNVLESVEIVSRAAKNKYIWHGKRNLCHTLVKLKMLARKDKIAEQMQKLKEQEMEVVTSSFSGDVMDAKVGAGEEDSEHNVLQRKDKSLGIMSQKFLMLFLVANPKTVNLETSAKLLIEDPSIKHIEAAKFKTKIRRLYDIANILTSLGLIKKIHVTEYRGRKPAFQYIGPDVDDMEDIGMCCNDGCHRPSSRHSLLDCVRNEGFVQTMIPKGFKPIRPACPMETDSAKIKLGMKSKLKHHMSEDNIANLSRKQSFDEICKVVELERKKLFGYSSQPTSPIRKLNFDEIPVSKEHTFAVPTITKHLSFDDHHLRNSNTKSTLTQATHSIPGKIIHRPRAVQAQPKNIIYCTPSPGNKPRETIIVSRTGEIKSISGNTQVVTPASSSKSPFEQIFQMKLSKSTARREIQFNKSPEDSGTTSITKNFLQSPDYEMAVLNETSPMPGTTFMNRTLKRNMVEVDLASPGDKRIRLELPTPPCGSTVKDSFSIITSSPSLSITPESSRITTLKRINSTPIQASPSGDSKPLPQIIVHRVLNKPSAVSPVITAKKLLSTPSGGDITSSAIVQEPKGKIVLENVTLTPGSSFKTIGVNNTPATSVPIRIIENCSTSSPSSSQSLINNNYLSSISQTFSPPITPVSSPQIQSTPTMGLKKVLTTSSSSPSLPSSQHSASSPFKIVIPSGKTSDGATATTTFLVRMPNTRLSKTFTM